MPPRVKLKVAAVSKDKKAKDYDDNTFVCLSAYFVHGTGKATAIVMVLMCVKRKGRVNK